MLSRRQQSLAYNAASTVLVLRTCREDMTSHGGFVWPAVGETAEAPDWIANNKCGKGLHGWLYGQGDHASSSFMDKTAKWLVVEVVEADIIMLNGKCKFPRGVVRFIGDKKSATDYLLANESRAASCAVIGATISKGDGESAVTSDYGTATDYLLANESRAASCAVIGATISKGDGESAVTSDYGTATAGYSGTATAGDYGTATAGDYGTATAGDYGTATAGYSGTATAGDYGTATAGDYGTATAGDYGTVVLRYWDTSAQRYRMKVAYVGEDGIEPNTKYRLDDSGNFVKSA